MTLETVYFYDERVLYTVVLRHFRRKIEDEENECAWCGNPMVEIGSTQVKRFPGGREERILTESKFVCEECEKLTTTRQEMR